MALATVTDHLPLVADYTLNPPAALSVMRLESTPTGFTLFFDRLLDPGTLNWYGSQTLGPADLTVTDTAGRLVRGSLVVHEGARSLTFVVTGRLLVDDTYTVTLRSGPDSFKDTAGAWLDGDGDGVPGGALTTRFSVASSGGAVLSAPEFARGSGQPVNIPATGNAGFPLRLRSASNVTRMEFSLRYDPQLLTVTSASLASGVPGTVTLTHVSPDVAQFLYTTATPFTFTSPGRNFVFVQTAVPDTAPYGAKHLLDLDALRINDGAIPARADDGLHVVSYLGDVTGNARYSSADATQILRVAVGLDQGFTGSPLADPALLADIDGNGRVTALDAKRVLQEAVGIDQNRIPPLPANPPVIITPGPDPLLSIPRTFRGRPGELVTVPVLLDRSEGLESAIAYVARRLEVVEVRRGSLTADFDIMLVNLDTSAGTLRVGLGRAAGPLGDQGSGSVLEIVFLIRPDAPAGRAVINLRHGVGSTTTQLNEGGLDLQPDPTDQAGDVLDGWVMVQSRHHWGDHRGRGRAALVAALLSDLVGGRMDGVRARRW